MNEEGQLSESEVRWESLRQEKSSSRHFKGLRTHNHRRSELRQWRSRENNKTYACIWHRSQRGGREMRRRMPLRTCLPESSTPPLKQTSLIYTESRHCAESIGPERRPRRWRPVDRPTHSARPTSAIAGATTDRVVERASRGLIEITQRIKNTTESSLTARQPSILPTRFAPAIPKSR